MKKMSVALGFGATLYAVGLAASCTGCIAWRAPTRLRSPRVLALVLWTVPLAAWYGLSPLSLCHGARPDGWRAMVHARATRRTRSRPTSPLRTCGRRPRCVWSVRALDGRAPVSRSGGITLSVAPLCWVRTPRTLVLVRGARSRTCSASSRRAGCNYGVWGHGRAADWWLPHRLHGTHAVSPDPHPAMAVLNGTLYAPLTADLQAAEVTRHVGVIVEATLRGRGARARVHAMGHRRFVAGTAGPRGGVLVASTTSEHSFTRTVTAC